ncbi:MAG: ankyrin repeat domain-containing protein [Acidobacteriaceae bacterium]|nr:ankyrin repeat domain-containing protein [Acidobacteriaceae bacterium]
MKRHFRPFERAGQAVRATFTDIVLIYPPEEWVTPRVSFPDIENWNSLRIRLERLACYGPCPVYSVEVHGDGEVFYEGTSGIILITGHHQDRISHDAVARLVASFREADYFSLKDKYATLDTDLPTFVTYIEFDGHKKRVIDYGGYGVGMPAAAAHLEKLVDEVAGTDKWLKGTSDTVPSLLREHWNFKANTSDNDKLFAVAVRRPDFLKLYLEHGFPPLKSPDPAESPLVSASYYGSPALLNRLMHNRQGLPATLLTMALSAAATAGDVPTMRFLIAHGANPNTPVSDGDHDIPPPLISAVLSGRAAAVEELLKFHPDVNVPDKGGEDAITVLLTRTLDQSQDVQILRLLIKAGANVNARDPLYGQTPVFAASDVPNSVEILQLLAKAGADLNARDEFDRTPLMVCFDIDYARALIGLGADVFARDNRGQTAAQAAREMGDKELAAMLESTMATKPAHN